MLIYPTVVLALETEFGLSYGDLLTLSTPAFLLFGLGALPAGWLSDRWSARGMMAVMFFGLGAAAILTGLATSPLLLAMGLSAIGLFASIYHPVGTALIVRIARRRGRDLGLNGIFGGLGIAAGPLIAGSLTAWLGWRAAFIVPGVVSLLLGVAFLRSVREIATAPPSEPAKRRQPLQNGHVLAFVIVVLASICVSFLFNAVSVTMPKVFAERLPLLGGAVIGAGGLVAAIFFVGAFFQYLGGLLADRFAMRKLLILALGGLALLNFLAIDSRNWSMLAMAQGIAALILSLQPVVDSLVARYAPAAWHGRAYGIRFLASILLGVAAVPIAGILYDLTGDFARLFTVLSAVAMAGVVFALGLPREETRPQKPTGQTSQPTDSA